MKKFHISDVLSVTTPYLLSTRHIDGVYDILNFLTRDQLFTHQLPRANKEAEPWLRTQFPQLMEDSPEMIGMLNEFKAGIEIAADRGEFCEAFVEKVCNHFQLPEYVPVYEMGEDMHTYINPMEEWKAMVGDDKVVVVDLNDEI